MNLSDFHFIRPYWLAALLPTVIMGVLWLRRRQAVGLWSEVCDAALLPFIVQQKATQQSRVPFVLSSVCTLLAITALAGPTWERTPSPVFKNDSALVIALDLSLSMNAADITPSRLTRARYKIADILKQRKDGQTALLVYAGEAFTVTPLTNDVDTIDSQLSALTTDIMPTQGSNTDLGLQKAVSLFKQAGLPKGQILLLTDGISVEKAIDVAKQNPAYTISVLAVGTAAGGPIKAAEGDFVKDANGTIVIPKLNTQELSSLANAAHGLLVTLRDDNQDVEQLTAFLSDAVVQEKAETNNLLLQLWAEQGPWLLLPILPLAALAFRKGLLSILLIVLLPMPKNSYALEWQDLWLTKDQQAQQAFQQQNYPKAAEQFKQADWQAAANYKAGNYQQAIDNLKGTQTADGLYNQGNALAQAGQLQEALKAYEQALKLNPNDADTKTNKAIVEAELKKQQAQKDKDKDKDKDKEQNKDQDQNKQPQDQKQDKPNDEQKPADAGDKPDPAQNQKPAEQPPKNEDSAKKDQKDQPAQEPPKADAKPDEKTDTAQQDKAEQKPDDSKASEKPAATQQKDETDQANAQWLQRIPDDPAGLLKRKFKYQYSQQPQQAPQNAETW